MKYCNGLICFCKQTACMSEVTSAFGLPDSFSRRCTSITHCPSLQLGADNQVCRDDEGDRKCSYCDYGLSGVHYQCKTGQWLGYLVRDFAIF